MFEISRGDPTAAKARLDFVRDFPVLRIPPEARSLADRIFRATTLPDKASPQQLAMPRIWNRRALTSKRVFLSMILGYALVPAFMAYQAIFYLTAQRFGAWSPAQLPYDDTLNTALPWLAVLFAGFFPAMNEEFLSRAFSIPIRRIRTSRSGFSRCAWARSRTYSVECRYEPRAAPIS